MPAFSGLSPQKRTFLAGTLLLTATGFACRVLGFFYRIFLSRTIGAEGLGLYNMVHPIFGICFSVCAGSIQTALSQYIASHISQGKKYFRPVLPYPCCYLPSWLLAFPIALIGLPPIFCWRNGVRLFFLLSPYLSLLQLFMPASMATIMVCKSPEFRHFLKWQNRSSVWDLSF